MYTIRVIQKKPKKQKTKLGNASRKQIIDYYGGLPASGSIYRQNSPEPEGLIVLSSKISISF